MSMNIIAWGPQVRDSMLVKWTIRGLKMGQNVLLFNYNISNYQEEKRN